MGDVLRGLGEDRGCTSKPDIYFYWAVAHPIWEYHFQGVTTWYQSVPGSNTLGTWEVIRITMGLSRLDVDWILGFLGVLLEKHLINAVSNRNSSNASGLSLSGNEIRRGRGARRGRPARQGVPLQGEIPAVQEGVGQANVAEPVGQQAMSALAREIAGALGILRAGNQAAEVGPSFLKREFFRSNPDEFVGDPKEPLKADEWLEQMGKTFEMLGIEDGALKVTLASFQLKGDAGQWWKYEKARVGGTWEAFVNAFQERFLSAAAREKLRDQFSRLNQQGLSVAEFEATFTSLSRFAPELVASEERRCYEFERKLRRGLKLRVGGSFIREYRHLVDAAAHMELMMQEEDEGQRGSKRGQDGQGDGRRQRGPNPQQLQGGVARSTFPVPSAGSGRGGQGEFVCYKCGQPGHKVSVCPLKGGGQRAASSSARPQSQSLGRGQPLSCYQCGQPGHLKRFCPQLSATSGASGSRQTQGFQPAQSVQASRANPGASSSQTVQQSFAPRGEQVDQGPTGRVYAVTAPDLVPAPSVVRGTFLFCNSVANVLIDTGASHSFVSAAFASVLELELALLASPICVVSPLGGELILKQGVRGCDTEVDDYRLAFPFVVMPMKGFDVILGMDWLSSYRAVIDCYRQRVTLCTLSGEWFHFLGDRVGSVLPPGYDSRKRSELSSLLASFESGESGETQLVLPRVVCEYSDVFPEDLVSLPPHREIEFSIDLVPGTAPISMAPYRFAPAELVELKV
ncbi:hypothetical protein HYC85_028752 [Camellia sinensis]|uniref:CCHC-type domain-containing protein n=1 Tax=Camellia sinensis TaxID=4442 RepID=A0A7J7FX75_CAMSI|nr:hypothetical protein HYC85_028752 [Camellia sinensis]